MEDKKSFWLAMVLVITFGGLMIIAAMSNKKDEPKMITIPQESSVVAPDTLKDTFMSGCVSDTATYAFCSCSYDSMFTRIGKEGIINMSLTYSQTNQISESILRNIVTDCASKL